jgi:uncharacterized protein YxjI
MSDLSSALSYHATAERIVDSAGNVVAERERRRGVRALIVSNTIVDATGQPLLKVLCRIGQVTRRVDVFTPQDDPVAHIKGKAFFSRPRKFTIRDGSGSVIGRIEGTWIGWEFRLLDNEGRLRARGVKTGLKDGKEWAVEIQDGQPLASPWPELTAAFFLSRRALEAAKLPP